MTTKAADFIHLPALTPEALESIKLLPGQHKRRSEGVCATEAIAWLAGEPHSDVPRCLCPTLGSVLRDWNDRMETQDRNRILKPLLPKLLGSNHGQHIAAERGHYIADWLVHHYIPAWLNLGGINETAEELRNMPTVTPHITEDQASRIRRAVLDANRQVAAQLAATRGTPPSGPIPSTPEHDTVRTSGYWSFRHAGRPHKPTELFAPQQALEAARYAGADMAEADRQFQKDAEELLDTLLRMWPSPETGSNN